MGFEYLKPGKAALADPDLPLAEMRGISKRFGAVQANEGINLRLMRGEVHALLGENGAGKTTLSKILYGFIRPDTGEILLEGTPVDLRSPRDARARHIGMVFQSFMLIPALSVLENVGLFLTDLPPRLDPKAIAARIRAFGGKFGLKVNPDARVHDLPVGEQQKVEILKLLMAEARILIFDEPTRVLAPHEIEALFQVFKALKAEGFSILFITHKLREVLRCADRISILRRGRVAGSCLASETDETALVKMMFGEGTLHSGGLAERPARAGAGPPLLELRGAATAPAGGEPGLQDLDLRLGSGEIVGIAGVSGSGQKALGDLILGLRALARGQKRFLGEEASRWSIARMRAAGLAFVPENPLSMAAVPGMSVRENLALGTGRRYHRGVGLDWRALEAAMEASFKALEFPMPPLDPPIATLSGGMLQRTVVARELAHSPKVIIALYPTRGLDVPSAASVRDLLRTASAGGAGVLLISEDLEELAEMADRLLVLYEGRIVGEFPRDAWEAKAVGRLMTGSEEVAHA